MSTTPPGPYPPASGPPPQQPPGAWGGPTGPFPSGPPAKKGLPTWAGVVIGLGVGAVVAIVVGVLVLADDDDEAAVTVDSTTTSPEATTSEAPESTTTTEDPDLPGGLDPVAMDAAESISSTFDATPEEEACMLDAFADNPDLFATLDEDELTDPDLMVEVIGVAKDCLDPEELSATFADGMLEGSDVELTPDQAQCLSDELLADDELLAVLVVLGLDPTAPPSADQIGPLFELFATCELAPVIAESFQASDPSVTDEQALCVAEGMLDLDPALIEEMLGMGDPGAEPSPEVLSEMLDLFSTCEVNLLAEVPDGSDGPT